MSLVFYASQTGRVRRVVFDELRTDDQLALAFLPGVDEASLRLELRFETVKSFDSAAVQKFVTDSTGLTPTENDQ